MRAKSSKTKKKKNVSTRTAAVAKAELKWPLERQVFFRPNRKKYVRKMIKESGCVFCKSAQAEPSEETLCVYKSKYTQIVLNKFPYNNGHLLVLPLRHCGDLLKLAEAEYTDLHATIRLAIEAVNAVYQPTGLNIGLNHGSSAGAGIPDHLHYHIVPRWSGDVNFFPLIAETKVVIETVEDSYKSFAEFFKGVEK